MSCTGVTSIASNVAPITINLPFGAKPSTSADIALEFGAILVTRNLRDFQRVPNLVLADWTI